MKRISERARRRALHLVLSAPSAARARQRPVSDAMTGELVTVPASLRVGRAAALAEQEGIHHLLVADGQRLIGVICEVDLAEANPTSSVVACVSRPAVMIRPDATLAEAAERMEEQAIGCLPVVEAGRLIGIVTRGDLRRAGVPPAEAAAPRCASCGSDRHVRLDARTRVPFCYECLERAYTPPDLVDDLGVGD